MKKIRNMVSGIEDYFEEALRYYADEIEGVVIEDIEDLCEYLNVQDIYGCGSSFEIIEED